MTQNQELSYNKMLREVIDSMDAQGDDGSITDVLRGVLKKRQIGYEHPLFGKLFSKLSKGYRRFRNSKYFPEKDEIIFVKPKENDVFSEKNIKRMVRDAELLALQDWQRSDGFRSLKRK